MNHRHSTKAAALATATACALSLTAAPANAAPGIQLPPLPQIRLPQIQLNPDFDPTQAAKIAGAIVSLSSGIAALIALAEKWEGRPEPTSEYLSSLMSSEGSFQSQNEQQLFLLINKERADRGLAELTWDNDQYKAAYASAERQGDAKKLIRPSDLTASQVEIASRSDSLWAPTAYREWIEETKSENIVFEPTLKSGAIAYYKHNNEGKWFVVFRGSTEEAAKPAEVTVTPITEDEFNAAASS